MLTRRTLFPALAAPLLAQRAKPNIILIVSDDHHWQCLGAAGNPHIRTPQLDRLAARGVLFTQAVISIAQCAPSRAVLLTGQEGFQSGLDSNGHTSFRGFRGSPLPAQLRDAGYRSILVGKWHITPTPRECGFTEAPAWLAPGGSPYLNPKLRHGLDATNRETPGHITDIFTREAVAAIGAARGPYLLWLAYNAPHTPWTASDESRGLYRGRGAQLAPPRHPKSDAARAFDWETYYAVITDLDAAIGRVVEAVERSGQWDNTLILFLGDNGYLCGSKGFQGKVRPWEESVRVPMIAAGGMVKRRGPSDAPVASVDVPATILDYAGVRSGHPLAGASLRQGLSGGAWPREAAFCSWFDGRPEALAVRQAVEPYRLARTPAHKYILWESKREALFDLKTDPFEEKNLAADPASAALLRRMKGLLRARLRETGDPAAAWL